MFGLVRLLGRLKFVGSSQKRRVSRDGLQYQESGETLVGLL